MVKFMHTADWHLGKKLFRYERIYEQRKFLSWLQESILEHKIDALLVSGDIFDTPTPTHEALSLYFDFLNQVTQNSHCQIFIIAGNHDSGHFLEAPKELLRKQQIHVVGKIQDNLKEHHQVFSIAGEEVLITMLPYFRQYEIFKHTASTSMQVDEMSSFFKNFFAMTQDKEYQLAQTKILMAHHLFGHYESAGSEQVVSLSGLDSFSRDLYQDFYDYVALGHIHKTQTLHHHPYVIYPGSPIPMRFGESAQKYVSIIKTQKEAALSQEFLPIPVFSPVVQLRTTRKKLFDEIERAIEKAAQSKMSTLLEIIVEIEEPESGLIDLIKERLKESNIELLSFMALTKSELKSEQKDRSEVMGLDPHELFDYYFEQKFPDSPMPFQLKKDFNWLMEMTLEQESP